MNERQARLLDALAHADGWLTAGELSAELGVTGRSVRSYVTTLKREAEDVPLIESGPNGYRIHRDGYVRFLTSANHGDDGPRERAGRVLRRLIDADEGLDVFELAEASRISESTVEADLARVRARLRGTGLALARAGNRVTLTGPETTRRRLLSSMFREESSRGMLESREIEREFPVDSVSAFKTALLSEFERRGDYVNEFGLSNVLLHVVIAVDRVSRNHALAGGDEVAHDGVGLREMLDLLVRSHFGIAIGTADLDHLSFLFATRVLTAGADASSAADIDSSLHASDLALVRRIVAQAAEEYLVELGDEDFLVRLALHVRNLVARAQDNAFSRNPLTRSIKSAYPMTYEVAVYIARELQRHARIVVNDDEIAYIAMHVGAQLEQRRTSEAVIEASVVSPSYHDLHLQLLRRIEQEFASELTVLEVSTRSDPVWDALPGELVVSTIEPPIPAERIVVVQPFLTDANVRRLRTAIERARRQRRRARLVAELLRYFDASLFLRNVQARDEEGMIRMLGARLVGSGVVDGSYVEGAIERERMSSTAFADGLAVPHAMSMSARRTSIAIVVNETPMDWSGTRVNLVAFIAFSESGRARFQSFFDQFVEVLSEPEAMQRIVKNAVDFPSFLDELAQVMDD
ncbi:BglG family transcription antiterminator [Luethyella okanaganae]|uniref:BglG family transcription antiterminator n=1 Tax=Luethyella okanaganae TaxID=69372 RepID=A0ABW1VIS2_9MICO